MICFDVHKRSSSFLISGYSIGAMNYSRGISFAKNGNIESKSDVGSYSYEGDSHRVIKAGSFDFTYDLNGNMITKLSNSALVEYKYDARDVLSQVTNAYVGDDGGRWAKFSYDASGQRFRKWSSMGNDVLYPNGYYAIKNSKWTNNHIYAGKERICTLVNGEPSFIHRDQINSGGLITTNAGLVGDKVAFAPYGEVLYQQNTNASTGSATPPLEEKFTGQILDEETGLYYYSSRYYNPKIGIFISADTIIPDPYDSQSMNRYSYVRGNPVKYMNPTGHNPELVFLAVAFVANYVSYGIENGDWGWNAVGAGFEGAVYAAYTGQINFSIGFETGGGDLKFSSSANYNNFSVSIAIDGNDNAGEGGVGGEVGPIEQADVINTAENEDNFQFDGYSVRNVMGIFSSKEREYDKYPGYMGKKSIEWLVQIKENKKSFSLAGALIMISPVLDYLPTKNPKAALASLLYNVKSMRGKGSLMAQALRGVRGWHDTYQRLLVNEIQVGISTKRETFNSKEIRYWNKYIDLYRYLGSF